ncbi:hypothetical protein GUITHDRAFT_133578 [Guillardia theta CCMP2712]|uniref:Uncharacterized protein n=1 Tax=Guillardia theta (strain CCMP2712) TaxID=905079 RepID=L1JV91_GUITC|nr:hypothetical protein GUITHDRAFT_133578 [Guillardia theta CCMP2712]EKX52496.1 hypothetical protein GUITHDRAFT_133578 [Guillardia theta CCMP2712]|eukprot:XP_005839476.1 hypothetical protein GUITHDRAFT_133578 [Guillardia theta CCMP2712]
MERKREVEYHWTRREEKRRSVRVESHNAVEDQERSGNDARGDKNQSHPSSRSLANTTMKKEGSRTSLHSHNDVRQHSHARISTTRGGPRASSCPCFVLDNEDMLSTCTTKHADLIKVESVRRIRGHFEDLLRDQDKGNSRNGIQLPRYLHYSPTKGSKASEVWLGSNPRGKKRFGIQRFRAAAKMVTAAQKLETDEMKERCARIMMLIRPSDPLILQKEAAERNAREEAERAARAAAKEDIPPFPNLIWNVRTSLESFVGKEDLGGVILDKVKNLYTMLHSP